MASVSVPPTERARKNEQIILQALAATGQRVVAHALGCDESTVSRMKGGDITTFAAMLAHLGLKTVPASAKCYPPEYVEALRLLAARGIGMEAPSLDWSEMQ